ncbi:MBL fold metallo-hydrolase [Oceaniglobus roseus]|uniref:MBL fold metallo-hydrolase n=1 Tax=Oceaniglobus roseus TaxID=1737570 RepID=UPI000C7F693A|nr:MBL fold metallo-hydrolase [Kandeliimicrobium roseum]
MAPAHQFDPAAFDPVPGRPETVAPGVRRILAPNPSPMTFRGTNTYVVGQGEVALIDPGPLDMAHAAALRAALAGERVTHILVTHAHLDHSPLAAPLAAETGAPVLAFGPATAGRRPVMAALAAEGLAGGGEGVDAAFAPTESLADGAVIAGAGWRIAALHTPGHMANHMCFAFGDLLFTGDHVMAWSTSLISPPDGDAAAFMASCDRLSGRGDRLYLPGHGPAVSDPAARLAALVAHRRGREAQILAALAEGPAAAATLTRRLYADIPAALHPAALRNVLAHLVDLHEQKRVTAAPALSADAVFALSPNF